MAPSARLVLRALVWPQGRGLVLRACKVRELQVPALKSIGVGKSIAPCYGSRNGKCTRASSLFAFLRPLISLIHSRLLSGHIPGGEGLCGCGGAYELAERINEMRTQFVQCVQCPQVVRAMSPGAGNVPKCEASPQAWVPCPQVRGWSSGVGALSPSARLVLRAVALPQVRG